jgi:hypothetical protein
MKTLWDEEQHKKRTSGPRNAQPVTPFVVKTGTLEPEILLQFCGYRRNGTRGWIRYFEKGKRFHAYIEKQNRIEIHTDIDKINKKKEKVHIATTYRLRPERDRLKKMLSKCPRLGVFPARMIKDKLEIKIEPLIIKQKPSWIKRIIQYLLGR